MWVIDIRHWLNESKSGPAVPQLRQKVKKLGEIIAYATSVAAGIPVLSPPRCWRRPGRKACATPLEIDFDPTTNQIHWKCPVCADEGIVSGWEALFGICLISRPICIEPLDL